MLEKLKYPYVHYSIVVTPCLQASNKSKDQTNPGIIPFKA